MALFWVVRAPAQMIDSTTALSTSAESCCFGIPITFTAVVTSSPAGLGTPEGTVDFRADDFYLGTAVLDGSAQATFTTDWLDPGSHSITARYSGDSVFIGSASTSVSQTVHSSPAVAADPANQAVCVGSWVSFAATATGNPAPSIQWQISTNAGATFVSVPGATNSTYTFATVASDHAGQYRAQFTNLCGVVASSAATLTVRPLPSCLIFGPDVQCANSMNQIYSAPAGQAGYQWSISGNGTISGRTDSARVTVNAGDSGTFTLSLTLTNATDCSSTCNKIVAIAAPPSAVVSGGGAICPGGSATLQATLTGEGPWTLTWSDGFTQDMVDFSPITRTVSPASTTNYAVISVIDANCSNSGTGSATVTVNTPPAVTVNPTSQAVCVGNSASFTSTGTGSPAPNIQWQVSADAGATFVPVPGATRNTYTFAAAAADNAKQYRAQFSNTCGVVISSPATITIYALPDCSISGAEALCAGSANQVYSAPPGLTAYRWSVSGSAAIAGPVDGSSVTVNVGASSAFTLSLTLTNANGCSSTCTKTVSITPLPTAVVSGGGAICPGGSAALHATLTGVSPWALTWSDGFTQTNILSSSATRSVSPVSTTNYTVTRVTDANCSNSGSGSAAITVNSAPTVTADPASQIACAGSPVSFLASATGSPTPAVQWQASPDGGTTFTNIPGATSFTYTFTASLNDNGKRFRASFANTCGSAVSSASTLLVNVLPIATITADPMVCANSTGNIASVPSAGTGASYRWTLSGGTITSGAGTSTITYTAASSGTISLSVSVTNAFGCSASSSQSVVYATQGKSIEAWKNKAPIQWQGSTFNDGDHQYSEGNSIPMRLELTQMCPGVPWCVVLRYDFKDGNTSRHFYDFLGTYNASEPTVNGRVLEGFNCSEAPTIFPIPADASLSYQLPGNFTVYNGAITDVSAYSVVNGSTICKQLTITGITTPTGGAKDVLILFGGHLARENEWGPGNGASSFPGASAKVAYQFCGASSFGNFAVNPAGIIKQADLSLTKTAAPNPLCAGNTLIYSLVVANSGPNQASPVTVLDALPPGTTLSSVSLSQGSWSGTTNLNVALGAVNAGSNATISIVVVVDTNTVAGIITNTATASAAAPADPFMLNNTATAATMVFPHPSATPLTDQVVCRGAPVTFSTVPIGAPPFTFQWTRNGLVLPGATTSSFSLPSVSASDAGTYCVIVSGHCNNITDIVTNCASLIISAETSTSPLADQVRCAGENASFSTTPAGAGPFTFTWKKDGLPIPGATFNTLTLTNISASSAGGYCVEVAGACSVTNACAILSVRTNTAATPLVGQTNCPGETATFATVASGTGPFSYIWRKDGTLIPGETRNSLTLSSVGAAQAGSYSVEVTGACTSITNSTTLTIRTPITAEPLVSQTNCPGTTATFSTTAHGDGPFTYQWAKDGILLAGQTDSSLALSNLTSADAGSYSVQVNGLCSRTTNSASLTINQNAFIANPPPNLARCPGDSASFTVSAGGTGPFTYQWSKDNAFLPGATNRTLALSSVSAADAGTYSVLIAGACGNSATASAFLTVNENVAIASPPTNITNCPGTSAIFTTMASGTGPFSYQWYKGVNPLPGQTGNVLALTNVSASDAGTYLVVVSGACGNAVTNSASLTMNDALVVIAPPVSVTNCPDTTAGFNIGVIGTGVTYQWFKGASVLVGQTKSTLRVPVLSAKDADTYRVVVTGVCGNTVTNNATLTVNMPTTADPIVPVTSCSGTLVRFSPTAHGTGPFTYQWVRDGSPLAGQTAASLTLPNIVAADAGTYTVRVSGACDSTTQTATLTVNTPVTADPLLSQTVCPGAGLKFSTTAHGTGPFSYFWIKDGKPLPGATTSEWSIPTATVLDDGTYAVIVTAACNVVTNVGTLTVHPPTTITPLVSQTLCYGQTATFSTTPSGTGPFSFTWKKNGVVLPGETKDFLTVSQLKAAAAGTYSVEVSGLCSSASSTATLSIESDGLVSPAAFANSAPIAISDFSPASPYPSTIDVSCVSGPLTDVAVTLNNFTHTYAADMDILLVSPSGQAVMLMSDAGGANRLDHASIGFSDAGPKFLPEGSAMSSGVYRPTDYSPDDNMPVPAPLGPYGTSLAALNGTDPNGTWSLYVVDDALADIGSISGGWSLMLTWGPSALLLQISPPTAESKGSWQLTLRGQSGQTCTIEASTDLTAWTPIATNTLSGPTWVFEDLNSTNLTRRFYRAVSRP
jgi:uncharacterized repeat protein (TIGR01451 family)